MSAEELATLAEAYGVDVGWLAEGERKDDPDAGRLMLAARELSSMRDEDLDRLLNLLKMMRSKGRP